MLLWYIKNKHSSSDYGREYNYNVLLSPPAGQFVELHINFSIVRFIERMLEIV